jgi:hypothetical protein
MRPAETTARLAEFKRRGTGTDAERRAARWLAAELDAPTRSVRLEPFWCRPNWELAHAWHVMLGLAGSLTSVGSPGIGVALIAIALLSVIADALTGRSPGRRLTPEAASQNVVALPEASAAQGPTAPVHLIITANYDAGRSGFAYRAPPRRQLARLANATHGLSPGWLGWTVIALAWLLLVAALRVNGAKGAPIGAVQLAPTVALVLALALLIDLAAADFGPAAGDNASGVAVAIAVLKALDVSPPRRMTVELVLQGAGDAQGIGLRRHLKARGTLTRRNTVVLGIAPCGAGTLKYYASDGQLVPLRYFKQLRELCTTVANRDLHLQAEPHHARGATPAFQARLRRLPAIAIGALDQTGLVPRSHQREDVVTAIDPASLDHAVEFGLTLVDAIDAHLAHANRTQRQATVKQV